jgi:hypothetical protein
MDLPDKPEGFIRSTGSSPEKSFWEIVARIISERNASANILPNIADRDRCQLRSWVGLTGVQLWQNARAAFAGSLQYFLLVLLLSMLIYLGIGLGFHFSWKSVLEDRREMRVARGEYVEPEVFWAPLALAFDVTFWSVYAGANIYHAGTPFAAPCSD